MNGDHNHPSSKALASLSLLTAMLLSVSSCSLGSMPSRTSVTATLESDNTETISNSFASDTSDSGIPAETELADRLKTMADEYMTVLALGDPESTIETFGLRNSDVLPSTYDCDQQIYQTLFSNLTYNYGAMITGDYVDYSLDVTCKVPDLRGCVELILADNAFMGVIAGPWVESLIKEADTDNPDLMKKQMKEEILQEAMRRVNAGEYTETIMYTECFRFHDNGDQNFICTKTPEFVTLMAKDSYMKRLTYIDMFSEYYIMENAGTQLVTDGLIAQQQLDELLEKKRQEIIDFQEGQA